ncbi:MAG: T9SS type A sorting domain-containing protein [Chitinophagales bacterium]|nr:T9SS type A sorting domain-containing protein [Chitinophagales bacterium]
MKNKHLLLAFFMITVYFSNSVQAQIIDENAYLQTPYLEVGINGAGAYVSTDNAPEEYNTSILTIVTWEIDSATIDTVTYIYTYDEWAYDTTCVCWVITGTVTDTVVYETYEYIYTYDTLPAPLGIICDVGMDGWDVGSPMAYTGDVTLPGSPEEGFGIEIGGLSYYNSGQYMYPHDIIGSFTSYEAGADTVRAVWEGDIEDFNLHIKQETLVPVGELYFYTRITLTNNDTETAYGIYYLRNVDPDQEQPWSYDFTTENVVVYNNPADSQCLVSAEGIQFGDNYTMYGTRNEKARVGFGAFFTADANPVSDAYNGVSPFSLSGDQTADIAIQVSFKIDSLLASASETMTFAYIFSNDGDVIEEALAGTKEVPFAPAECLAATDIHAEDVTENSANITWLEGSAGLEYDIEWRKVGIPDWNHTTIAASSLLLEGLESCTYYDYRLTTLCGSEIPSDISSFKTSCIEGVENIQSNLFVDLYPNPASDNITLSVTSAFSGDATIKITDAVGRNMYEDHTVIVPDFTKEISVENLAAGIYFVTVEQNGFVTNKKLVITD